MALPLTGLVSIDAWSPYGAAPYSQDNAGNGESWEFVFDTSENALYTGAFSILTATEAPPVTTYTSGIASSHGGYIVRDGQEVWRGGRGVRVGTASLFDSSNKGDGGFLLYEISTADLGIAPGQVLGVKWGPTCANDTIEGAARYSVPAPGSLLLLAIGFAGLLVSRSANSLRGVSERRYLASPRRTARP